MSFFNQPWQTEIGFSPAVRAAFILFHLFLILIVVSFPFNTAFLSIGLIVLVVCHGFLVWRLHHALSGDLMTLSEVESKWYIGERVSARILVKMAHSSLILPWIVITGFREVETGRYWPIIATVDNCSTENLRQLRVRVRWSGEKLLDSYHPQDMKGNRL